MTGMQQFILGIASAVIAAASGYLLHRRSKVSDATSAQSGVAANHRAGTQQVIDGFNLLLDQYQETIKDDREVIVLLESKLVAVITERDFYKAENARLRKKYGDNGDTPQPPNKGT